HMVGRLKPGVTAAQVEANLESVFQHTARAGLDSYLSELSPAMRNDSRNRNRTSVPHLLVEPGGRGIYDVNVSDSRAVTILSVVVVLVLLIVCANVANLLLSRAATRQREISVRLSLGATRGRLVRQLLTESLLLAAFGGALGIVVGRWGQQLLPLAVGQVAPLDWRVLTFVLGVTMTTGVLFGIAPALRATATSAGAALKESSRSVAGSRTRLSKALLVVQVAVSLVLLVGAGLFLRTLQNLRNVDIGFNARNLVVFQINPALNRYDDARTFALHRDMAARLGAVTGVRSVAMANVRLIASSVNSTCLFRPGRSYAPRHCDSTNRLVISPGFFETMAMSMRGGRALTDRDDAAAAKAAVINETAARTFFPNENPIGARFGTTVETADQITIVGVVGDAKYDSVRDAVPPTIYVPYLQQTRPLQGI